MLRRTYSYLLFFCCREILGGEIHIKLEGKNDRHLLSKFNALPKHEKFVSFKLMSCFEGIVWFLSNSTDFYNNNVYNHNMYKAYIGSYYNTNAKLIEFKNRISVDLQTNHGPQVDCSNYKQFWFSWDDGYLMVGKGSIRNQNVLLIYEPKCPFDTEQIGISGSDVRSHWIFNTTTQKEQTNTQIVTRYRLSLSCQASRVVLTMDTESKIDCLIMCSYDKQCKRAMYKSDISPNCELMTGEPVRDGTRPNYIPIN